MNDPHSGYIDRLQKEIIGYHAIIEDLRDEIARLRGALKYYADFTDDGGYARRVLKGGDAQDESE